MVEVRAIPRAEHFAADTRPEVQVRKLTAQADKCDYALIPKASGVQQ